MDTALPRWAALLISAMLVTPFLVALFPYLRHHWRVRTWTHAEATVTKRRSETSRQGDGSTTTTVTFSFADAAERDRTGTAVNPVGEPRLGGLLEVMYDPADPDRSTVVELGSRYVVMLAVFALLFALGVSSLFVPLG